MILVSLEKKFDHMNDCFMKFIYINLLKGFIITTNQLYYNKIPKRNSNNILNFHIELTERNGELCDSFV